MLMDPRSSPVPDLRSQVHSPAQLRDGGVSIRNETHVGRALGNTVARQLSNSMTEQAPRKPQLLLEMVLGFSLSGC